MAEFYEFHINKHRSKGTDFAQKDQTVFNKNEPQERLRALQKFRHEIEASMNLALHDKSCCSDELFLSRFLYAKKFQCDEALKLLIKYILFKKDNPDLLQRMNIFDEKIQSALRDGNPRVLAERDRKGRKVITFAASNWDPNKYSLEDVYRAFLLTIDKLLENIHNQALGFVVIVDWTNFALQQSMHLKPKTLKLMIDGLQESIPVNFKGIHFIAQPWYVDVAFAVIKSFLKEKTKKRLKIHGSNLSTLHNHVNKDILPPDLGGEGPNITTLDWYHYLLESSQLTESPKKYRLIEYPKYSTVP